MLFIIHIPSNIRVWAIKIVPIIKHFSCFRMKCLFNRGHKSFIYRKVKNLVFLLCHNGPIVLMIEKNIQKAEWQFINKKIEASSYER